MYQIRFFPLYPWLIHMLVAVTCFLRKKLEWGTGETAINLIYSFMCSAHDQSNYRTALHHTNTHVYFVSQLTRYLKVCFNITKTPGARFSKTPETFRARNVKITELFYSHTLNMNRVSLHTRSFRGVHFPVFRYRWTTNGFMGPKRFRGFRETGPRKGCSKRY